eukprot:Awhi_evm1s896
MKFIVVASLVGTVFARPSYLASNNYECASIDTRASDNWCTQNCLDDYGSSTRHPACFFESSQKTVHTVCQCYQLSSEHHRKEGKPQEVEYVTEEEEAEEFEYVQEKEEVEYEYMPEEEEIIDYDHMPIDDDYGTENGFQPKDQGYHVGRNEKYEEEPSEPYKGEYEYDDTEYKKGFLPKDNGYYVGRPDEYEKEKTPESKPYQGEYEYEPIKYTCYSWNSHSKYTTIDDHCQKIVGYQYKAADVLNLKNVKCTDMKDCQKQCCTKSKHITCHSWNRGKYDSIDEHCKKVRGYSYEAKQVSNLKDITCTDSKNCQLKCCDPKPSKPKYTCHSWNQGKYATIDEHCKKVRGYSYEAKQVSDLKNVPCTDSKNCQLKCCDPKPSKPKYTCHSWNQGKYATIDEHCKKVRGYSYEAKQVSDLKNVPCTDSKNCQLKCCDPKPSKPKYTCHSWNQ